MPATVALPVASRDVKRPVLAVFVPIAVFSMPPVARNTPPTVASPEVVSVVVDTPLLAVSRPPKVPVPDALRLVVVTPPLAVSRPVRVEAPATDSALPRVVAPVTPSVPATVALPVASRDVKRPLLAVVAPIEVLLIVPLRTSMFWMRNSPESSMIARTTLPAMNCSGCELVEPR